MDPFRLHLTTLMRKGIDNTDPLKNRFCSSHMTRACPIGAIKAHLYGYSPSPDAPRWERVREYLLKFDVPSERFPDVLKEKSDMDWEVFDEESASLHMLVATLNDTGLLSREAIVEWLEKEFTDEELTVRFGEARDNADDATLTTETP